MSQRSILILGGARSGKSRHAMRLAEEKANSPVLIATAIAGDQEMRLRIARHRRDRGANWTTVEEPLELAGAIASHAPGNVVVVDCLTLWLSNLLHEERDCEAEVNRLLKAVEDSTAELILVSNEVGLGIVPATSLGRKFRDEQGSLNQRLAEVAGEVVFLAAGLPLPLKS
ncbi:MAG: bifunctional adenosylcobinamide kinase/adenosylcobinamide-phosphate guanylyltransferase [Gammaproteobacteria bacterium]|nr:bifunctional adenosylcobinamide kinase/adenosylcobinamide-phosphate guanylyltransferase [Gammaproteobacteria bacterium]